MSKYEMRTYFTLHRYPFFLLRNFNRIVKILRAASIAATRLAV
jgi:hypothetical protein